MNYTKTVNFDDFKCIADRCPESCCLGWQIMIDEESLDRYRAMPGEAGALVRGGVDFEEQCFLQYDGRCSMLAESGLCRLQLAAGEEALCVTCDRYPRHTEEFEGEREYSLSLSCPEAARMILTMEEPLTFETWQDEEEEYYDDEEGFDELLYERLREIRELLYGIVQNRGLALQRRMALVLELCAGVQECLDDDRFFEMDEVMQAYVPYAEKSTHATAADYCKAGDAVPADGFGDAAFAARPDFDREKRLFSCLFELEYLHEDWGERLLAAYDLIFGKDLETHFPAACRMMEDMAIAGEQLLMFFIYTYFCGAVYDDMIYTKAALAVYSTRWIFYMTYAAVRKAAGASPAAGEASAAAGELSGGMDTLIRAAYSYAREIEHSELNLNVLEELFDSTMPRQA